MARELAVKIHETAVKNRLIGILSAAAIILCAQASHAGLMGSTVNMSAYFPDSASLFLDPGNVIVSGAVEFQRA